MKPKIKTLSDIFASRDRSIDWSAFMGYLPDPDPVLKKMNKSISAYSSLMSDAHVWSCSQSRKSGTLSLEWEIRENPKGKIRQNRRMIQVATEIFDKLDIYRIISEILDSIFFGMAPLEIIWKPEGGLWIPDKIEGKPQDWFVFSQENELRFLTRDNMVTGEEIPPYKFLNPVHHGSYNNPYGERCLSRCFWPVTFKKSGFKFWAIFVEKYGMPWVVGKVPRNTHGTERSALLSNLEDMVQDAVAVINDDEAIDITEPGGKTASSDVYSALVSLANREVSKAILGQTLSTELDQGGSFAAAKSHMEVRADLVDQDKRLVEKTMNQLLQWIVKLNFADTAPPVFAFFEEENLQNERAERDEKLKSQGVRFTKNYYIRTYNLEEDDFEIVEPETEPGLPGQTVSDGLFSEKKNENIDLTKNGYDINAPDVIAYDAANRSQDELSEMIRPVMEMIQNAESFEEIGEKLFSMYPNMESRRFQELLARAMNAGALTGYFSKPDPGE